MKALQRKIESIKNQINNIGVFRPGNIITQYNVCGSPGCKCKNKINPQKHGPYSYLCYTFKKKSFREFIPQNKLKTIQKQISNYKKLKLLIEKLIDLNIELAKTEGK